MAAMRTVCQKCGDEGDTKRLVYCIQCRTSAEHRYCLDKLPKDDKEKVIWTCYECTPKDEILSPIVSRKSERITFIKERAAEVRMNIRRRKKEIPVITTQVNNTVKLAEATQLKCELLKPTEKITKFPSCDMNSGNQVFKKLKRRLILDDGSSSDEKSEESEPVKVSQSTQEFYDDRPAEGFCNEPTLEFTDSFPAVKVSQSTQEPYDDRPAEGFCNEPTLEFTDSFPAVKVSQSTQEPYDDRPAEGFCNDPPLEFTDSLPAVEVSQSTQEPYDDRPAKGFCNDPPLEFTDSLPAEPVMDPVWRGCFRVRNKKYGIIAGLAAHLSTKASSKVYDAARALPPFLDVEILPRADAWPARFVTLPPTNDSIGLYFWPEYERDEDDFDMLLEDMIDDNLAIKSVIANNVELLVFLSSELPMEHWRIQQKYYLWAVFRQRKESAECVTPTQLTDDGGSRRERNLGKIRSQELSLKSSLSTRQ